MLIIEMPDPKIELYHTINSCEQMRIDGWDNFVFFIDKFEDKIMFMYNIEFNCFNYDVHHIFRFYNKKYKMTIMELIEIIFYILSKREEMGLGVKIFPFYSSIYLYQIIEKVKEKRRMSLELNTETTNEVC